MALVGSVGGVLSQRARASGLMALILAVVPGVAIWQVFGRG